MLVILVRGSMVVQKASNGAAVSAKLVDYDSQAIPFSNSIDARCCNLMRFLDIPNLHVSTSSLWASDTKLHFHAPFICRLWVVGPDCSSLSAWPRRCYDDAVGENVRHMAIFTTQGEALNVVVIMCPDFAVLAKTKLLLNTSAAGLSIG